MATKAYIEMYENRLDNALRELAETANGYCWNPTSAGMAELQNAVDEWRSAVGLYKVATRIADA